MEVIFLLYWRIILPAKEFITSEPFVPKMSIIDLKMRVGAFNQAFTLGFL